MLPREIQDRHWNSDVLVVAMWLPCRGLLLLPLETRRFVGGLAVLKLALLEFVDLAAVFVVAELRGLFDGDVSWLVTMMIRFQ
jgi:hypothetical protein